MPEISTRRWHFKPKSAWYVWLSLFFSRWPCNKSLTIKLKTLKTITWSKDVIECQKDKLPIRKLTEDTTNLIADDQSNFFLQQNGSMKAKSFVRNNKYRSRTAYTHLRDELFWNNAKKRNVVQRLSLKVIFKKRILSVSANFYWYT